MRLLGVLLVLATLVIPVLAQQTALPDVTTHGSQFTNRYDTLKTTEGEEFLKVKIKRREGGVIVLFHSSGIARIPIAHLPPEVRDDLDLPTDNQLATLRERRRQFEERQEAKGLTKHQGRWINQAERQALQKEQQYLRKRQAILQKLKSAQTVEVKDLKNFANKYEGKVVRVDCMVSEFERDEREGCFEVDMQGVQIRSPSTMDVLSGSNPDNVVRGDGIYLFNFVRIALENEKTAIYCNNKMDGRNSYYANVFLLINKDDSGDYYGSCITIQFKTNGGKVYYTTPVESF